MWFIVVSRSLISSMTSAVPISNKLFHYRNEYNRNIVNTQYLAKNFLALI